MQIEIPLLPSHPHPQFVAVKSLISFSSEIDIYNVSYASGRKVLRKVIIFEKNFFVCEKWYDSCYSRRKDSKIP